MGSDLAARPLDGVRVADLTWFGAGPIAARTLASFGADVIHIESEARVDGFRTGLPRRTGARGYNASPYFNNWNAGKRSFLLNMSVEGAREVALRLIAECDVFICNMAPGVIDRWRLNYEDLREARADIIAAYQPMQGSTGPHRDYRGFGAVLNPVAGLSHLTGEAERAPIGLGTNFPDFVINPGHTAIAILAALRYRRRTGKGQKIELSQLESVAATIGPALLEATVNGRDLRRIGNRSDWMCPHNAYRCLDGPRGEPHPDAGYEGPMTRERWITIAVQDDAAWAGLCGVAAGEAFAADERFATLLGRRRLEAELDGQIAAWAARQDARELMYRLQGAGVAAAIVQDAEDLVEHDEHVRERGFYRQIEHAETGSGLHDGPVARLHGTPGELGGSGPLFGEHTFEIATELLGYTADEVAELTERGVLA